MLYAVLKLISRSWHLLSMIQVDMVSSEKPEDSANTEMEPKKNGHSAVNSGVGHSTLPGHLMVDSRGKINHQVVITGEMTDHPAGGSNPMPGHPAVGTYDMPGHQPAVSSNLGASLHQFLSGIHTMKI